MISDKHLGLFLESMTARNFTEDTKRNYKSMLLVFGRDFKGRYDRATIDELTAYIAGLSNSNYMAATYASLKFFYKYVLKQKKKFPFIPFPEREQRLPHLPAYSKVFEAIEKTENTKHNLILSILFGTGIRLSEIIGLRWKDIRREQSDLNPISLHVRGKGKKHRIVPLSKANYDKLIAYCKEYSLGCETNKEHFIFGNDKPYSKRSVANVVAEAGDRVGIKLHPHLLRHLSFSYLREQGVDLTDIQQLAGHSSSSMTMKYARFVPKKITMPI